MAAEEEEFWQELVMAEVGGLLDRKGKLVSTLSLYRFVDLMEILHTICGLGVTIFLLMFWDQ